MSFSTFLKSLFKKENNKASEEEMKKNLKALQHKYLNKTPSEISKMNVRDITMALKQLNDYCVKKIQKANTATDTNKQNLNLLKQAKVSEQAYKYICELLTICASKNDNRLYSHLPSIKHSARIYNPYIYNFQTAFDTVNKVMPGALTKSPNAAWQKLIKNIPDGTSSQSKKA